MCIRVLISTIRPFDEYQIIISSIRSFDEDHSLDYVNKTICLISGVNIDGWPLRS